MIALGVESVVMLAIALEHALWGRLMLGVMAPQSQSYLISFNGNDVGFATLSIQRISTKEVKYSWKAELAVSGDPCLHSTESTSGKAKLNDAVLPEELFVALAPDIGTGCRKIRGAEAREAGQGCWTEASQEHAAGTLFGTPVQVNYGPEMLPASVKYPKLGLAYRVAAEIPEELGQCQHTVADDGVPAPGAAGLGDGELDHASYRGPDGITVVHRSLATLPPAVVEAIDATRDEAPKSCKAAAEALSDRLKEKHLQTRMVSGLLLEHGRYYPHAWLEVKLGKEWVPIDATTGSGTADARHLSIGPLGDFRVGIDLLRLIHSPPEVGTGNARER